ncbi:MAG TPA: TAT-variant-translocated molybdopterin oxidoreductase, partial [Planctomycetota bacterium]|nr:TAT-variant-translocated molybdopterin oxidoreductase [Planctomycetota bacterium]
MSEATTVPDSSSPGGVKYWRSLEQLENTAEFQAIVDREFADGAAEAPDEVSRRGFLGVIAASVALAGLTSCRKPVTHILPFNARPEGFKPGIAQYYATTLSRGGYGLGVLVRSNDGRPTKIEGNPLHPSSLGGSDAFLQGEILQLYDPARSRMPSGPVEAAAEEAALHGEAAGHEEHASGAAARTYDQFRRWWATVARALVLKQGEGLRLLVPPTTSRSLQYWQTKVTENFPKARFHTWEPIHRDAENAGSQMALGRVVDTQIHFGNADVVVSFDCDFLALDGANLRHARHWAQRRKLRQPGDKIARLYVAESCFSTTGTMADHRFRMRNADTIAAVFALAGKLGLAGELGTELQAHKADAFVRGGKNWIDAVARDLQQSKGRGVVVAGPRQPAVVHAVVHAINAALDAVGKTITYTATPAPLAQSQVESIAALKRDVDAGQVEVLVCLGTNPVYDAPADLQFKKLLADKKVKHTIHVGLYKDETGQHCDWHFNAAHDLESWGDAQAHDGTVSLRQPLIAPLHGGISAVEFLALLTDQPNLEALVAERDGAYGHQLVKDFWKASSGSPTFDSWWKQSLHDGVV